MERAFSCPKTQECWREQEWLSRMAAESTYSATLGGSLLSFLLLSWLTFRLLDRQGSILKSHCSNGDIRRFWPKDIPQEAVQSFRDHIVGLWFQHCQSLARPLPTGYFMNAKISVLSFST